MIFHCSGIIIIILNFDTNFNSGLKVRPKCFKSWDLNGMKGLSFVVSLKFRVVKF